MEPMSDAALVLFSGGQDSTTCLAWALDRYAEVELGIDPYELRLKNANRIGDTSPNQIVYTDPSTVPTILAIADAVGHELTPEYRAMTPGQRTGDLLPEHLVGQLGNPEAH